MVTWRRQVWRVGSALAGLWLASCWSTCVTPCQVLDEFEQDCGEVPCGWTTEGDVTRVPSFHGAHHGMRIAAGAAAERELDVPTNRSLEMLLRCDAGASLQVTVREPITSAPTADAGTVARTRLLDGWTGDSKGLDERTVVQTSGPELELRLETLGSGQCLVDMIRLAGDCER